jgi:high affinity Mn2+ porin
MEAAMAVFAQTLSNNTLSHPETAKAAVVATAKSRQSLKVWLAVSTAALVIASAGHAATDDLMVTKARAILYSGAAYNWNGFYAGGHLGNAWGSSNWTANSPGAPNVSGSLNLTQPIDSFSETGSFFAGLQAGYNYMLPNRFVLGGEVDASFPSFPNLAGISIGGTSNLTSPTFGAETYSESVLASGTVRGRLGYAPGSWLFYATGGFAWTYDRLTLTQLGTGPTESPFLWRLGFAAGAGVEAPIAPHWTARLEYLFTDYGNSGATFFGGAQRFNSDFMLHEVRAGVHYLSSAMTRRRQTYRRWSPKRPSPRSWITSAFTGK